MAVIDPEHLMGIHRTIVHAPPRPDENLDAFSDEERARLGDIQHFGSELSGYMLIQSTRPQTLAYALADSPVGQLAWIVEKFKEWTDSTELPEDAVDRDQMLTNVMLYWLTTAGSSSRLYYELRHWAENDRPDPRVNWNTPTRSLVPAGVAVFPKEVMRPIRRLAERYDNIVHWTEFDRGGHFAAMEAPDLLVGDIRTFFRSLGYVGARPLPRASRLRADRDRPARRHLRPIEVRGHPAQGAEVRRARHDREGVQATLVRRVR
jgi:microsomal epoxide hydrolase